MNTTELKLSAFADGQEPTPRPRENAVPVDPPVVAFAKLYISNGSVIPPSVMAGVSWVGDFAQVVLHREGPFQVVLCLCRPNSNITPHGHPTVDSLAFYISGQLDFQIERDGRMVNVFDPGGMIELPDGRCALNQAMVRFMPGQRHAAKVGPLGGAFLTIQHWLDGKPTSVERDWDGAPLSPDHAAVLKAREDGVTV